MSSSSRYMTFEPTDRFSWPTEEVAQRLTSAWLLECCCRSCCCPWKRRRMSQKSNEKSGPAQELRKNDKKVDDPRVLDDLTQDDESNSNGLPLNVINKKNQEDRKKVTNVKDYRGKYERDERESILMDSRSDSSNSIDDGGNNNEDIAQDNALNQFSKEVSSEKMKSDERKRSKIFTKDNADSVDLFSDDSLDRNNTEKIPKMKDKISEFLVKSNKPLLRKYSLNINDEKKNNIRVFRKYSLDAGETQKLEDRKSKTRGEVPLHSGDYIETDGSPIFKRCVSFRNKKSKFEQSAGDNENARSSDFVEKQRVSCMSSKISEKKEEECEEVDEENDSEDEERKGLFDSDTDSEDIFEFVDNTSSDDFYCQDDKDTSFEIEKKILRKTRLLTKNGILSVLPNVQETEEEIYNSSDDGSSLSEACSTPIIGAGSRTISSHAVMDMDDIDRNLHSGHLATRASLSSLGARSDSMASVYSGAGEGRWCGSVAVRGEVEFSLQYDYKQLTFEVHVTQCRDLAPVDVKRNRSDPYVKVYLLPDKSKSGKRKTKVKKHTLNPVFDETLKFHMSLNGLETRTLWLTVWHSDMFGRNDFLGEVRMPLENKIFDDPRPQWYPLQERTEPFDDPIAYKGEVIVGLKFVPPDPAQQEREREMGTDYRGKMRKNWSRGALHVLVKEARNLQTRAKHTGSCDPFCKSYLLPDKGRSGKQKTGVVRRSGGSPVWNHTFVYKDVSLQELAERGLELTVWDHDRIASNEFLGGVRFNLGTGKHYGKLVDWMDATGRELSLWQSMLERPNFWVEGAVTLRPNLHNHVKSGSF